MGKISGIAKGGRERGRDGLISNQDSAGSERCSWAFAMKINQARVGPPGVFPSLFPFSHSLFFSLYLPLPFSFLPISLYLSVALMKRANEQRRIIIRLTELWLIDTYRSFTIMGQLKISALVACLRRADECIHTLTLRSSRAAARCRICENSESGRICDAK